MESTKPISFASRDDRKEVEQGEWLAPKFDADGLIPAVAQDADNGEILMLAYMNEDSLRETIRIGEAVYWSRSRQEVWHKGATSGHVQTVEAILTDCDQDAIVLKVRQKGPGACHVGYRSCFYRRVDGPREEDGLTRLGTVYEDRAYDPNEVYG